MFVFSWQIGFVANEGDRPLVNSRGNRRGEQRLEAGIRAQRIECGYASVESIRERLADPPSDSAVRAMLAKLEAKGYVRHREEGLR